MNKIHHKIAVTLITGVLNISAWAGPVGDINVFTADTTAVASEVNDNFTEHTNQINDNDAQISINSGNIAANEASIATKQNRINAACKIGSSIRKINEDSSVDCQLDSSGIDEAQVMPIVLQSDGPASQLDADTLDGQQASSFMSSSTDNWVDTSGDSMTGGLIVNGNLGLGNFVKGTPVEQLDVRGNAIVSGDMTVKGALNARITGPVDVTQITGLLGSGFTMQFPDIIDNLATLEVSGVFFGEVVIISGPGVDIERIEGFFPDGRRSDRPGFSMEHPFIFETTNATDEAAVKLYFDTYAADPVNTPLSAMSLIVDNLGGSEVFRWNIFEFKPEGYAAGVDGRTRFSMAQSRLPNNNFEYEIVGLDPFGIELSNNLATDTKVEWSGVTLFYPQVDVDQANLTITFTYDFVEGNGVLDEVKATLVGSGSNKSLSVIVEENGLEVSRKNYFEAFPIKYEQFTGYGLDTKIRARVTLAYGSSEDG